MSTHNLCFGAKIRKIGITLHTPVLPYKSGVYRGIQYTDMLSFCYVLKHIVSVTGKKMFITTDMPVWRIKACLNSTLPHHCKIRLVLQGCRLAIYTGMLANAFVVKLWIKSAQPRKT